MHTRRLACLLIGIWLGCEILVAFITLVKPGPEGSQRHPAASVLLSDLGPAGERLWNYRADELARSVLRGWGAAQIALGTVFLAYLLFGTGESRRALVAAAVMLAIAIVQRTALLPEMLRLDESLDFAGPGAAEAVRTRAVALWWAYAASEALKWVAGAAIVGVLVARRRRPSLPDGPIRRR